MGICPHARAETPVKQWAARDGAVVARAETAVNQWAARDSAVVATPARQRLLLTRLLFPHFRYVVVVCSVNLTLNEGEHLALVGPNGSGKTTLALALRGQAGILSGRIECVTSRTPSNPCVRCAARGNVGPPARICLVVCGTARKCILCCRCWTPW